MIDWKRKRSFGTVSGFHLIVSYRIIQLHPGATQSYVFWSYPPGCPAPTVCVWGDLYHSQLLPCLTYFLNPEVKFKTPWHSLPSGPCRSQFLQSKHQDPLSQFWIHHAPPHHYTLCCLCASPWKAAVIRSPPNSRTIRIVPASAGSSESHCCLCCCLPF